MLEDVKKDADSRMGKTVDNLRHELIKIRTGRAHTSLLDHITVEYYGSQMPINQVATVTASDSRTLTVQPWEKNMVQPIEKAIMSSDLGLNPPQRRESRPFVDPDRRGNCRPTGCHRSTPGRAAGCDVAVGLCETGREPFTCGGISGI